MLQFVAKAALSGVLVALIALIARRYPGWGGLVASLPLTSLLAMLWLYGETRDSERVAALAVGTYWFILPSLPMFLILPALLRGGMPFAPAMGISVAVTLALYAAMAWLAPRAGIPL